MKPLKPGEVMSLRAQDLGDPYGQGFSAGYNTAVVCCGASLLAYLDELQFVGATDQAATVLRALELVGANFKRLDHA